MPERYSAFFIAAFWQGVARINGRKTARPEKLGYPAADFAFSRGSRRKLRSYSGFVEGLGGNPPAPGGVRRSTLIPSQAYTNANSGLIRLKNA